MCIRDSRTADDYDACSAAGAAFVGMVFFPRSPRHLSMQEARTLADHADRSAGAPARVALTVDMDDTGLEEVVAAARPRLIQLHGSEPRTGRPPSGHVSACR